MTKDGKNEDRLYRKALGWLGEADFTRFELQTALSRETDCETTTANVLSRLVTDGLLDDARIAKRYVLKRSARHRGPQKISMELRARGLDEDLILQALNQISSDEWQRYATELLDRTYRARRGRIRPVHQPERFLTLRGYLPAHVQTALSAHRLPAETRETLADSA